MLGTTVSSQLWIGKKSVSFKKKIYNFRQLSGRAKAIIMLMYYPQTKSNLIRAICKRGSTRKISMTRFPKQGEPIAINLCFQTGKNLCQISREVPKGRILIQGLYKETWIPNFKTFNKFKWRTKDNKIFSQKTLGQLVEFPTQLLQEENSAGLAWCLQAWCSLKRGRALCEAWIPTLAMTFLVSLAQIRLTVTWEIVQ